MTTHSIPLTILVDALDALEAARALQVHERIDAQLFIRLTRAAGGLSYHVRKQLEAIAMPVTTEPRG